MQAYPNLLSPMRVGNLLFKNRVFTAPTGVHALQKGELYYTEPVIYHMARRAAGGPAMVTCSGVQVNPNMASDGNHLHINPYTVPARRSMMDLARRIHHYDCYASMELGDQFRYEQYWAVSPGLKKFGMDSVEMPPEIMEQKARMYADAAAIVQDCGFDMLMLHIGHAGELGQFLSPLTNHRTDAFGGSLENRARFPLMVIDAVRERVGKGFVIELRFSVSEVHPQGTTVEQSIQFCRMLRGRVDLLHASCGMNNARYFTTTHPSGFLPDTPNVQYAQALKDADLGIPVVAIGGIQNPDNAEAIIAGGKADFVSVARGIIAEPNLVNKARTGAARDIRPCIKCFKCHDGSCYYDHYVCSVNPEIGMEDKLSALDKTPVRAKRIAVVGGGPAGMECAVRAAGRGHDVTLYEASDHLGGNLNFADHAVFKRDIGRYKAWLIRQLENSAAQVRLNTPATAELLEQGRYEHIILALGSRPLILPIPGVDHTVPATQVFGHEDALGGRVVIIGGGQVGAETGIHLSDCGRDVTILEMREKIAPDAWFTYKWAMDIELNERENLHCIVKGRCAKIEPDAVTYTDENGDTRVLRCDSVVLAAGMQGRTAEAEALILPGVPFTLIGDCKKVGTVQQCTADAFDAAMNL